LRPCNGEDNKVINKVFFLEDNHCQASFFDDGMPYSDPINRAKAPEDIGMGDDGYKK
jgi:hypothetical protein